MDFKLELQHEVETCVALAFAVGVILNEVIDNGGAPVEPVEHAGRVLGLLQDRLDQAKALTDSAIQNGLAQLSG